MGDKDVARSQSNKRLTLIIGSVYVITNLINGKKYVGQTKYSVEERWRAHKSSALTGQGTGLIHKAIRKYGVESFVVTEVAVAPTQAALDESEDAVICALTSLAPHGYNLKAGGGGRCHHPDTKRRMSEILKGRPVSQEQRDKISASNKGRKFTDEHRANLSVRARGNPKPGMYRPIIDQHGTSYESIQHAAISLGVHRSSIADVLKQRRKHIRGYIFTYLVPPAATAA